MKRVNWHTLTPLFREHAGAAKLTLGYRATPQRWYSFWRSADRPAPDTDPADLGTAFGLEMSLLETPPEPVTRAKTPRPGWMYRLTTRRGPAT